MRVSSPFVKTQALNPISTEILLSQCASDPEDDMSTDYVLDFGYFQKRNNCEFADLYGEVKIPRLSDKPFTSSLSPFAKAFVPRKSRDVKRQNQYNKTTLQNVAVNTIQQCGNLKSCLTENEEFFE